MLQWRSPSRGTEQSVVLERRPQDRCCSLAYASPKLRATAAHACVRCRVLEAGQAASSAGLEWLPVRRKPVEEWRPAGWKPDAALDPQGPKARRAAARLGMSEAARADAACVLQVAFVVTTSDSYKQISLWVKYHHVLGVSVFYLFVDGQAAQPEARSSAAVCARSARAV